MPHPAEHASAAAPLDAEHAEKLAETLRAFASPSRLRILTALIVGERTVDQLARDAGLTPSATSHQLRLLRAARVVRARKQGRQVRYALHDHHVTDLIAAVRHHHEHLHPPASPEVPGAGQTRAR